MRDNDYCSGFHFIEILIVIGIISLLAVISLPVYSQHVLRERRLEAAQMLTQLAIAMEDYQVSHNTYEGATLSALDFPEQMANNHYQLQISLATVNDYLISAIPIGKQAKQDVACGTLSLDSTGKKSVSGSGTVKDCW